MPAITDEVPAYRLRREDLETYLEGKFPEHTDFDIQVRLPCFFTNILS
jgi:hypothetical protein